MTRFQSLGLGLSMILVALVMIRFAKGCRNTARIMRVKLDEQTLKNCRRAERAAKLLNILGAALAILGLIVVLLGQLLLEA